MYEVLPVLEDVSLPDDVVGGVNDVAGALEEEGGQLLRGRRSRVGLPLLPPVGERVK